MIRLFLVTVIIVFALPTFSADFKLYKESHLLHLPTCENYVDEVVKFAEKLNLSSSESVEVSWCSRDLDEEDQHKVLITIFKHL